MLIYVLLPEPQYCPSHGFKPMVYFRVPIHVPAFLASQYSLCVPMGFFTSKFLPCQKDP